MHKSCLNICVSSHLEIPLKDLYQGDNLMAKEDVDTKRFVTVLFTIVTFRGGKTLIGKMIREDTPIK